MPRPLSHLTRRFFDVLFARPLTVAENAAVRAWLGRELATIFFEQAPADQRHGYHAALRVIAAGLRSDEAIAAALLHDVGKRHANLGIIGRSVATVLIWLGVPLTVRMTRYREHGAEGGRELAEMGAPSLAIEFTLHHQGDRPETIQPDVWAILLSADQPPNTMPWSRSGITSSE